MRFTFLHTADWQIGKRFGAFPARQGRGAARSAAASRRSRWPRRRQPRVPRRCWWPATCSTPRRCPTRSPGSCCRGSRATRSSPGTCCPAITIRRARAACGSAIVPRRPAGERARASRAQGPSRSRRAWCCLPAPLDCQEHEPRSDRLDGRAPPRRPARIRIGLAHGSVQGFGSAGDANVPIDPARVKSAGPRLSGAGRLARHDAHLRPRLVLRHARARRLPRQRSGPCARRQHRRRGAAPKVERVPTAHFTWLRRAAAARRARTALAPIEAEVARLRQRRLAPPVGAGRSRASSRSPSLPRIEERLAKLAPQLFHLAVRPDALKTYAATSDLDALSAGVLGTVAQRLKAAAEGRRRGGRDRASRAAQAVRAGAAGGSGGRGVKIRAIRLKEVGRFSEPIALEGSDRRARRARRSERARQVDDPQGA